jgi:glycosidase
MLGGDRRRIELAYSLQLSMPGTPVIRYGEEIGMGGRLDLPEREAIRTPMQSAPATTRYSTSGRTMSWCTGATERTGSTLFVHNLADQPSHLKLRAEHDPEQAPLNFVADSDYGNNVDLDDVHVAGYGYRWVRLRRTIGG